jgi:cellulose synthase/poly-beta-1,6-N-acetylglucosamine synthase-like glycosyltransferase
MDDRLSAIVIVVPARNEEELLGACLLRLGKAMDRLNRARPELEIRLTVVLDQCRDSSPALAASFAANDPRLSVLSVGCGVVGATRAAGIDFALESLATDTLARHSPERIWIACTDADTRVPVHWLTRAVKLAESGSDVIAGTVEPDSADMDQAFYALWWRDHDRGEGHGHIHGANLGFRASAYCAVGGFDPVPVSEDVLLVEKLRRSGARVTATGKIHAITSGRMQGRVGSGFAGYLRKLAQRHVEHAGEHGS